MVLCSFKAIDRTKSTVNNKVKHETSDIPHYQ